VCPSADPLFTLVVGTIASTAQLVHDQVHSGHFRKIYRNPKRNFTACCLDPRRLDDDYVPTGFAGYGVRTRAVKGHEFGLKLSAEDQLTARSSHVRGMDGSQPLRPASWASSG